MDGALLVSLVVLSLLLLTHDLVPLGRWNSLPTNEIAMPKRMVSTGINSLAGLIPTWLAWRSLGVYGRTSDRKTITIFLVCLVVGELLSWWVPWLTGYSPIDRKKLTAMTAGTYSFVPARHGVRPNALHCVIHLVTVIGLVISVICLRPTVA